MITCQEMIRNLISLTRLKTFLFYLFPLFIFNWIINHRIKNVIVLDRCISFVLLDALSPCEQEVTIELGLEAKSVYHYKEPTYERWVLKKILLIMHPFLFSIGYAAGFTKFIQQEYTWYCLWNYEVFYKFLRVYGFSKYPWFDCHKTPR